MTKLRLLASVMAMCSALGAGGAVAWAQTATPPPPPTTSASGEALAAACETASFGFQSRDGGDTETCTVRVESFDGAPLDVDITRDAQSTGAQRHKLIAMLHGFGGDKREYESKTDEGDGVEDYHYNSHWFAERGYYVITYTARGFETSPPPGPSSHEPNTPPAVFKSDHTRPLSNNKIRLKSKEFEIRDTRLLMQLTATAFPTVDPDQAAVTGLSYGGGESWLQASERTVDDFSGANSLGLKPVTLQVAVPRYSWTDLGYGLAPNGHANPDGAQGPGAGDPIYESSTGKAESSTGDGFPFGVPKSSYIGGFFLSGNRTGTFQTAANGPSQDTSEERPIDIVQWNKRVATGDPFSPEELPTNVFVKQARRGLTEFRSSYYQDKEWRAQAKAGDETAIFAIGGWTDDLFPAVEQFRQYKFLKRLDPRWPVEVHMADIGHPRAQNKPRTWRRLNQQAFGFIQSQIPGAHRQVTYVTSEPTICGNDGEPDENDVAAQRLTDLTPEGLAAGRLTIDNPAGVLPLGSGTGDPDGVASDPVVGGVILKRAFPEGCVESKNQVVAGRYTSISPPLTNAQTYVGLGSVTLPYKLLPPSDLTATVNARVWDMAPNGQTTLITRGTYRLDAAAGANDRDLPVGTFRLPLFGNHWPLKPGHRIRLDLMQVDESVLFVGTFQRSKVPDMISFSEAKLELPVRQATSQRLTAVGGTDTRPVPEPTPGLLPGGDPLGSLSLPGGAPLPLDGAPQPPPGATLPTP